MAIMSHAAVGLTFNPASSSSPSSPPAAYTTPPVFIAFTIGILVCFTVGFCFIYLCRCCVMNHLYAWAFNRPSVDNLLRQNHSPTAGAATPIRGIDPALLQIFPTFPYASVKEFQGKNNNKRRCSLECAICLLEFEEDSFLRLLTVCCHVFHQECIDLWLESHKTCPVCRTDLNSSLKGKRSHEENQTRTDPLSSENNPNNNNNETRIDVREEEEDEEEEVSRRREEEEGEAVSGNLREVGEGEGEGEERRFPRSHSTGHSIIVIKGGAAASNYNNDHENEDEDEDEDEDGDKYTLKLPEHVQVKLIREGYNYAKSCSSYTEMTRLYGKCCYAEAISTTGCTTTAAANTTANS